MTLETQKTGGRPGATEQLAIADIVARLPVTRGWARAVFARLERVVNIPRDARVLDVGAAAGSFVAAATELGYRCEGVEPWSEARERAGELAQHLGLAINIVDGSAESIPFDNESFDLVHAATVLEHVRDLDAAIAEVYRVLKPGGVFWFSTTSAMCPRQNEIRGFPLFGWYPLSLKRRIMEWARVNKPHLIGHTATPAIHWFTPGHTRRLLQGHGFRKVFDRWDLRLETEGGGAYRTALKVIRSSAATKTIADMIVPDSAYAAVK